ncbi:MAG TPA: hypothetical protein VH394_22315 [Thermoanaerobaculia bacterium]|jgi:hypothetical protein|nr:hypothetical protein [Thermoanaerobaculia bacterium]
MMFDLDERERFIGERLRGTRVVCMALAGSVLAYGIAGWFLIEGFQLHLFGRLPDAVPLSLTFLAAVLILLGSRIRTAMLKSGLTRNLVSGQVELGSLIPAYQRATLVSFAMLEFAALMGLLVALLSGSSFYGLVLCLASFFSMLLRWPRAEEVDRLARGRVSP